MFAKNSGSANRPSMRAISGLGRVNLRFHAFQFALFLEGELARLRCFAWRRRGRAPLILFMARWRRSARAAASACLFLLQIIIVVADAVVDLAVAFKRQNVGADAVQKIAVVADHAAPRRETRSTPPPARAASAGPDHWSARRESGNCRRSSRSAPATAGCVRRRESFFTCVRMRSSANRNRFR